MLATRCIRYGIRNFCDEDEEVTIRFSRPVTLIHARNGTERKTTVTEASKYAISGEFLLSHRIMENSLYEIRLRRSGILGVRVVVTAETVDREGNVITICRTLECSRVTGAEKFKTLDNILYRIDA
ncbi:DNA repair protein RAD50-like isoform X2 [Megalopta genalis]|uniref:DNA repair protein RAD50-like isoform X2 n=1 Tax=Megalopta genalis TaxID=115081 RepID=UPI003FD0CE79